MYYNCLVKLIGFQHQNLPHLQFLLCHNQLQALTCWHLSSWLEIGMLWRWSMLLMSGNWLKARGYWKIAKLQDLVLQPKQAFYAWWISPTYQLAWIQHGGAMETKELTIWGLHSGWLAKPAELPGLVENPFCSWISSCSQALGWALGDPICKNIPPQFLYIILIIWLPPLCFLAFLLPTFPLLNTTSPARYKW